MGKTRLSEEEMRDRRLRTRDMAFALVEDIAHIREIVSNSEPDLGAIRRLSAQLRRLLVNDELAIVAAPRIGRVQIQAPDLRPIHRMANDHKIWAVFADQAQLFDGEVGPLLTFKGDVKATPPKEATGWTDLNLDQFIKQKVLSFHGAWATRADVIKYVANKGSGVHSGEPDSAAFEVVSAVRATLGIKRENGNLTFVFNHMIVRGDQHFIVDRSALDVALLSLIVTGQLLAASKDIRQLEQYVADEE